MASFLLEIGTEELPADFARLVVLQLEEIAQAALDLSRIRHGKIECSSTPRRIFLLVNDLALVADDFVEQRKGPPAAQAFENGVPTPAAIGFAKRCGLRPEDLQIRETPKGPFAFAQISETGKLVFDLLIDLIPQWITDLQGRRFMKWGVGERRFSRPIRWIVSLLDDKLIPINLNGCDPEIQSGNISKGHRLFIDCLEVPTASKYASVLANQGVIVDRNSRRSTIEKLVNDEAIEFKAFPDLTESLLDELTDLVESPFLIRGQFDQQFLKLPPEVLTTVMKVHQRYIPLYLSSELILDHLSLDSNNTLLPFFLCISNGLTQSSNTIRKGNERVLRARLSDAKYFVDADLAIKSETRRALLDGVSFEEGLGTLLDRVKRIELVGDLLVKEINLPDLNTKFLKRASYLCKHDLVSQIVGEFPELEGIMGGKYLLAEGEPREVALAVSEHYLPRSSTGTIPESDYGGILAIADKFDLLLSIFAKGQRPSGSSDPYALRRAGNGILQILWSKKWSLDFNEFFNLSINHWSNIFPDFNINTPELTKDLSEFFRQRIISLLEEEEIDVDLVLAVAGKNISTIRLLSDPSDIRLRANLLQKMRKNGQLSAVQAVVTRASRLAEKSELPPDVFGPTEVVNEDLFEKESESRMLKIILSLEPIAKCSSNDRYLDLANGLTDGADALAEFFDGDQSVMVMTDDLAIRANRLNLLRILNNQASILADFSEISG